jgi:hypothetical protein
VTEVHALRVQIVDEHGVVRVDAELAQSSAELIELQLDLCADAAQIDVFLERLRRALGEALGNAVHYDLKPPSRAQIEYATAIATALSVPLAPEVLRYRGHMHAFLDEHVATYHAGRQPRRSRTRVVRQGTTLDHPDEDVPF